MIPEELRNFIEQNCSGKEPSDLIMEAIGKKIEQLGADADEVLAFVEECTKGLTLEQKAEAAKKEQELLAFLKHELDWFSNKVEYDPTRPEMLFYSGRIRYFSEEMYNSYSKFYSNARKDPDDGKMHAYIEVDIIKEEAVKYKDDNEMVSLLKKLRNMEAKALYNGAKSSINKEIANKSFDPKCLDEARRALVLIQNNYSDIEGISSPDLEKFIEEVNRTYLAEEQAKKQRKEMERQKRMEQRRLESEERKLRQEAIKETSFLNKLKMIYKILFNKA